MKTEIEAEKRFPTQPGMVDTEQEHIENSNAKHGFIMGADYMRIRAIEWLSNAKQYINPNDSRAAEAFIEAFNEAMEV